MIEIIIIIGAIWLILSNLIEIAVVQEKFDINCPIYSPSLLYENTKMNWFGCWFIFILIRIFIPINTIIGISCDIMTYIWEFIEWLFTVGRKDD